MTRDIHWCLIGQWQPQSELDHSHLHPLHGSRDVPDGSLQQTWGNDAPVFEPPLDPVGLSQEFMETIEGGCGQDAIDNDTDQDVVTPASAASIPFSGAVCNRCCQSTEECFCEDVLCTACLRSADHCECKSPCLKRHICVTCGSVQPGPFLHTNAFLELRELEDIVCQDCGGAQFHDGDWNFLTASDHSCGVCHRRDCQHTMRDCDGKNCDSEHMFHSACLTTVLMPHNRPVDWGTPMLCPKCMTSGNSPDAGDSDSDDSRSTVTDTQKARVDLNGDFRLLPPIAWEGIYSRFRDSSSDGSAEIGRAGSKCNLTAELLTERLSGRLHYALDFVEAVDAGKLAAPSHSRDTVLRVIRQAREWQRCERTADEIALRIEQIDKLMTQIIGNNT